MSNQEAIALLRNLEDSLDSYCELSEEGKTAFRMAIEALSSSENPNNSDCISRKAAIDAMRSIKPIATLSDGDSMIRMSAADHVLSNLPPAQPKREVTRNFPTPMQELLEVTANRDYWEAQCHVYEQEIERIRGRWIPSDTDGFVCSVCRNGYRNKPTLMGKPMFEFCPVCGAKMEKE